MATFCRGVNIHISAAINVTPTPDNIAALPDTMG